MRGLLTSFFSSLSLLSIDLLATSSLYSAVSLFIFAATARPGVHWFWPCFSLWLFTIFIIPIYVTVNTYLSDSYETYASSALSSSGALRFVVFFSLMTYSHR